MEVGPTNSVLVVEDQPVSQMVISHQLHKLGYEGDIVTNGHEAIDRFAHGEYLGYSWTAIYRDWMAFYYLAMQRIEKVQDRYIPIVALRPETWSEIGKCAWQREWMITSVNRLNWKS